MIILEILKYEIMEDRHKSAQKENHFPVREKDGTIALPIIDITSEKLRNL